MELDISELETSRLGLRVGRAEDVTEAEVGAMLDWARGQQVEFLIARCAASDSAAALTMMRSGGTGVSVEIHYRGFLHPPTLAMTAEIAPCRDDEAEQVQALADAAFRAYPSHYRFARRLDPAVVEDAYKDWTRRCLDGSAADVTLVARDASGRVLGFSAFGILPNAGARLVLGAVSPSARGQQLYAQLTIAGMEWAKTQQSTWLLAITQAGNIPAQRSWVKVGMSPFKATSTFHFFV